MPQLSLFNWSIYYKLKSVVIYDKFKYDFLFLRNLVTSSSWNGSKFHVPNPNSMELQGEHLNCAKACAMKLDIAI